MYTHTILLRMTDIMIFQNIYLSSWDILYNTRWQRDMNYGQDLEGSNHVLIDVH
jgi:hypothetical protein